MNIKLNAGQLLQAGLLALVSWLFKTVNELQSLVAVYMVQIEKLEQNVVDLALREKELNMALTEVLIRLGGGN
jgi:hypothetical protein